MPSSSLPTDSRFSNKSFNLPGVPTSTSTPSFSRLTFVLTFVAPTTTELGDGFGDLGSEFSSRGNNEDGYFSSTAGRRVKEGLEDGDDAVEREEGGREVGG